MKIRPCIDIHNGKVKQIVGSSLRDGGSASKEGRALENYVSGQPADYYAGIYRDRGLTGGHIILLNAKSEKEAYEADCRQAFAALAAWPGGMQIGGGITPENAGYFLDAGASHVIVTSYVFRDGRLDEKNLEKMIRAVGREHLVLDLSCRRASYTACCRASGTHLKEKSLPFAEYYVVTDRWQKWTELEITRKTLSHLSSSCDEFLIHAADVEGRRAGIETGLVRLLGAWQQEMAGVFPVTYAGGVHSLEDIALIREESGGRLDVTIGSALSLFGGDLRLEDAVSATR